MKMRHTDNATDSPKPPHTDGIQFVTGGGAKPITMKRRITPEIKRIADAHIQARIDGKFDDPVATTIDDVFALLREGKTFSAVMEEVELRYAPITAIFLARHLAHQSHSYKTGVYKGFKKLFTEK